MVYNQIIVELNNHFIQRSTQLLRCIACLDLTNSFASFNRDQLIELVTTYVIEIDHYELIRLTKQLDLFITDVRSNPKIVNFYDLNGLAINMIEIEMNKIFWNNLLFC